MGLNGVPCQPLPTSKQVLWRLTVLEDRTQAGYGDILPAAPGSVNAMQRAAWDASGVAACRFVPVEASAYPSTHLGERP